MQIVIVESPDRHCRWRLLALGDRRTLCDSDRSSRSFDECLRDLRINVERWASKLGPTARRPLAEAELIFEPAGEELPLGRRTMRQIWPDIFDRVDPREIRDRPLRG